ncbi:class I SAM-dependent methyltransferase [Flavihumibacter sp. R14]|nr:class I SAM-dependent methyltransferase [Flavihumibacter soli]
MSVIKLPEEIQAEQAFDKQSAVFDELYTANPIIQYKRSRVRDLVLKYVKRGNKILELNAGTGEDAVYFAEKGMYVHATDISEGMQEVLRMKAERHGLQDMISTEVCSFTNLTVLRDKGPYDLIFSNFAGLNCTSQLDIVLKSFSGLLRPGGMIVLVIMPGFCVWETLLSLRGNFKTAFRRFRSRNGADAQIEGVKFMCWYYSPDFVIKTLGSEFRLFGLEGLCSLVPPSYLDSFPSKWPRLFKSLVKLENVLKDSWPWKNIGDYFIISMKRRY